jgi:hypothetical protein
MSSRLSISFHFTFNNKLSWRLESGGGKLEPPIERWPPWQSAIHPTDPQFFKNVVTSP